MTGWNRLYLVAWVVMVLAGIGGFAGSIGGWITYQTTGDPGCHLVIGPDGVVVESVFRSGSSCDAHQLVGTTVLAIDGVDVGPTTQRDELIRLMYQKPSTVHRWRVSRAARVEELDLRYEFGPLAVLLEKAGDGRADLLVGAMTALAALARTLVFGVAAVVLFHIGLRRGRALLLSGAAVAYALGLGFDTDLHQPWHPPMNDLATVACVVGLSSLLIAAPGLQVRSRVSYLFAITWSFATVLYLEPVLVPWSGPSETVKVRVQLAFMVLGIALLIHRSISLRRADQHHLRWILVAMIANALVAIPLAVPLLTQAGTEAVKILLWPVIQAALPLAVLNSLDEQSDWDVQRVVRWTTHAGSLVMTLSTMLLLLMFVRDGVFAVLFHRGPPGALNSFPAWTLPALGLGIGLVLTALASRPLIRVTETLLFPGHTDVDRYRAEAMGVLEDCWDRADVAWCARSVARAAVGSEGGRLLVWQGGRLETLAGEEEPSTGLRELALTALESPAAISIDEPGRENEPTLLVPLRRAGEPIGVLVVPCPADHRLTRRERLLLDELAAPFAQAVWQHTRAAPVRVRAAL